MWSWCICCVVNGRLHEDNATNLLCGSFMKLSRFIRVGRLSTWSCICGFSVTLQDVISSHKVICFSYNSIWNTNWSTNSLQNMIKLCFYNHPVITKKFDGVPQSVYLHQRSPKLFSGVQKFSLSQIGQKGQFCTVMTKEFFKKNAAKNEGTSNGKWSHSSKALI